MHDAKLLHRLWQTVYRGCKKHENVQIRRVVRSLQGRTPPTGKKQVPQQKNTINTYFGKRKSEACGGSGGAAAGGSESSPIFVSGAVVGCSCQAGLH